MSDHHDDDEEIDEEQLADYCAMLDKLGNFPVRFIFYLLLAIMSNRDFLVGVTSGQQYQSDFFKRLFHVAIEEEGAVVCYSHHV